MTRRIQLDILGSTKEIGPGIFIINDDVLAANTALSGVLEGTPVASGLPANSIILSNKAEGGDILVAAKRSANSEGVLWYDASAGVTHLYSAGAALQIHADMAYLDGTGVTIGHATQVTEPTTAEFQLLGTVVGVDAAGIVGKWGADADPAKFMFLKSRDPVIFDGTYAILSDNDPVMALESYPDDGVDLSTLAAIYRTEVDDASPEAGGVGMAHVWLQMPGGGTTAAQETMRLTAAGVLTLNETAIANVSAAGAILAPGGISMTDVLNAWIDDTAHGTDTVQHFIGQDSIDVTDASDERVKENFTPFNGSVMEKIRHFDFINYDRIDRKGRRFGMTAQDMQQYFPEYVWTRTDDFLQIAYHKMMPVTLRGLQELDERMKALEAGN